MNRGLPPEMKNESQSLKRGETTFKKKGEILLQSWRDTRVVNMISTKHSIKVELHCLNPGNVHLNNLKAPILDVLNLLHSSIGMQ